MNESVSLDMATVYTEIAKFGLTRADVENILIKFGPTVLKLVVDGLKQGINWAFIQELLTAITPLFSVPSATIIDGTNVSDPVAPPITGNIILNIILKMLPGLLQQYWPQISQWMLDSITAWINSQQGQTVLMKALNESFSAAQLSKK